MDYHAGNTSEQADARPAHLGACEVNEDAKILSETTPADVSLDIIPQNRVRLGYREPHDVIRTYDANILVDAPGHSKAADYEDLKVGTLRFHIINMEFPRERGSFTDHPRSICDSHSGEMYGLYAALYQDNGELKRSVANRIDPDAGGWCSVFAILFVELRWRLLFATMGWGVRSRLSRPAPSKQIEIRRKGLRLTSGLDACTKSTDLFRCRNRILWLETWKTGRRSSTG
jgi:hypothetical protein